jgi:TonB family protein
MGKTILLLLIGGLFSIALGQPKLIDGVIPGGTINGKPIPETAFQYNPQIEKIRLAAELNRPTASITDQELQTDIRKRLCQGLNGRIREAAKEEAMRELHITAAPQDIDAYRAKLQPFDALAQSKWITERAALILNGLAAVDRGQNAHQVYVQMMEPKGINEHEWELYLLQGRTPEGRAIFTKQLSMTPDVMAKGAAKMDLTYGAMSQKLDDTIDQQIAAKDPQFRTYLDHFNYALSHHSGLPLAEQRYVENQRAQWWKARESKVSVVLNDQKLITTCAEFGANAATLPGNGGSAPVGPGQSAQEGVFRVGNGVSVPILVYKVDPDYTEEARAAKLEGTVVLYVEVDVTGTATNIKVQRSLGLGLDEKAIEAVKQWRFKPGQKDGKPVTTAATLAVNFRL